MRANGARSSSRQARKRRRSVSSSTSGTSPRMPEAGPTRSERSTGSERGAAVESDLRGLPVDVDVGLAATGDGDGCRLAVVLAAGDRPGEAPGDRAVAG